MIARLVGCSLSLLALACGPTPPAAAPSSDARAPVAASAAPTAPATPAAGSPKGVSAWQIGGQGLGRISQPDLRAAFAAVGWKTQDGTNGEAAIALEIDGGTTADAKTALASVMKKP